MVFVGTVAITFELPQRGKETSVKCRIGIVYCIIGNIVCLLLILTKRILSVCSFTDRIVDYQDFHVTEICEVDDVMICMDDVNKL